MLYMRCHTARIVLALIFSVVCCSASAYFLGFRCNVYRNRCMLRSKIRSMDDSYRATFNNGLYPETVLYNDDDIIVVDKPANIQTAPGFISNESLATRVSGLFNIPRVDHMIVHRLDYATSGVVVFAKNGQSSKHLHKLFRTPNQVKKVYKSIVSGSFSGQTSGVVHLPIGRDNERGPPFYKIKGDASTAKASRTHWEVLLSGKCASLLRLTPHTGRTHQLRLHMAAIGHPILGDFFYGHNNVTAMQQDNQITGDTLAGDPEQEDISESAYERADRLLLHAEELQLLHPRTLAQMRFIAVCPFHLNDYD